MAAAAVVSVSMGVMKPVLDKLTTLMGDEYKKLKGLRKMVTFLQCELREMDALLEKMDSADELDIQAKNWRKDIIEMSYNIEDCIDDFMQRVGQADDKVGILQKASQYLRTFNDRRRLANQFQEIKARVMEASERRKRYMLDQSISITAPVAVDPRLSTIYKESASLVGIDAPKDKLVSWAMDKGQQLKVMAVVGFGGLGKTTLANEVYREVGGKFDCKAFVSVSQKPEMIGLFNSLLSQLGLRPYSYACLLQDPINDLLGHLHDKRYFIIVDDLWDMRAWETIQCAFPRNNLYSRVMITTRKENLARPCCGNHGFIHTMKPLSEHDSRKLFIDRIFGSEDAFPSELTKVSCEILKKCGGMPLAIITVASMLACQVTTRSVRQWEYIRNSLATTFATNSNYEDMMYILDLSYKNLPRHLKACFLYLGSYPEDHDISRVELARRWVAEGFVSSPSREDQDVWDVAESYFNELVNRSMIQPTYRENIVRRVSGYRVHDMLRELIVTRCKEDNFLSLVNDPKEVAGWQDKVIRRLTVVAMDAEEATMAAWNLSQVRSLTIFRESKWIPPLLQFKSVRVLFLEIPYWRKVKTDLTGINQLSQLRYLRVDGDAESTVLPGKIQGLRLLQTLELFPGRRGRSIALEITNVPRLSHLVVPSGTLLPNGIGELKSLRTLDGFCLPKEHSQLGYSRVDDGDAESTVLPCQIQGLGKLTALKALALYLQLPTGRPRQLFPGRGAALGTSLEKLGNLEQLSLSYLPDWPVALRADSLALSPLSPVALRADSLGLSSLSPPFRNLEQLDLQYVCTFSRVPGWIGYLGNLRELWLGVKHLLQEDVTIIGTGLRSLIHLGLRIPGVPAERIVIGGSTGFPVLEWFMFNCDGVSYLTFEAGAMPELRKLELLLDANKWDKAPPGGLHNLPSLQEIKAWTSLQWQKRNGRHRDKLEDHAALIRRIFQGAAGAVPTRPAFASGQEWVLRRPSEEGEYFSPLEEEDDDLLDAWE